MRRSFNSLNLHFGNSSAACICTWKSFSTLNLHFGNSSIAFICTCKSFSRSHLHFGISSVDRLEVGNCLIFGKQRARINIPSPTTPHPSRDCPLIVMFSPGKLDCIPQILEGSTPRNYPKHAFIQHKKERNSEYIPGPIRTAPTWLQTCDTATSFIAKEFLCFISRPKSHLLKSRVLGNGVPWNFVAVAVAVPVWERALS
jgi:hypothetical protein